MGYHHWGRWDQGKVATWDVYQETNIWIVLETVNGQSCFFTSYRFYNGDMTWHQLSGEWNDAVKKKKH